VDSDEHGPADLAAADGRGEILKWKDPAKFVPMPEEAFRSMRRENRTAYTVNEGLWRALQKSPGEGVYGELDILEVMTDNPKGRMTLDKPADAHIFYPTLEQARSALAAGYKYVDVKNTKFKPLIPGGKTPAEMVGDKEGNVPAETRHYVYNRETAKPEHVAMWIPEDRYQRHIHAVAAKSRKRIGEANGFNEAATREALERAGVKNPGSTMAGIRATGRDGMRSSGMNSIPRSPRMGGDDLDRWEGSCYDPIIRQ
jgi:hypothetical protein